MAQIDQVAVKKTETTGSYIGDVEQVVHLIFVLFLSNTSGQTLQTYPCFRSSLLPGIVSGAGFGFIRGMSTRSGLVAGNWAVGTFLVVSTAGWFVRDTPRFRFMLTQSSGTYARQGCQSRGNV
jgi:hypothetical protein